jgi:membrane fusion protein, multidrug efflux system
MKKLIIFFIIPLFLTGIFTSCGSKKTQAGNAPAQEYAVLPLVYQIATIHFDYPATIEGQQVIEIRPKIEGYIEAILVSEGASVKKGQLLFRISNPEYEEDIRTAQASIKSAEAEVYTAQMNVNKVIPLVEKDIVSKYELESAKYTLQAKQAALAQAQASLANARTNLGYTLIRSPLNGVIGNIPYKIGALVNSSTTDPLTTLSDISQVYAYFSLNEKQLMTLSGNTPGATLQDKLNHLPNVSLVLADGTEYPEKGKLETASGLISTTTGSASLKAVFSNPKGTIRSGASAIVRMPTTIDSALLIPQSATYEVQNKRFVFVVGNNNKVYSTLVGTTPTDDGQFFIVNNGLSVHDKVVLTGVVSLRDSMQIIPKTAIKDSIFKDQPHPDSKKK